ncbi:MAG: nitroreductase/quinone reductase family protein [Candidatus Limnocylindria bacterium]
MQAAWHMHRLVYRASGRRLGRRLGGHTNLLLRTRGRKSGERRETLLWYVEDGPSLLLVASNAGSGRHPAWFLNLVATPDAEVWIGEEWRRVTARRLSGDALDAAWRRIDAANPSYRAYRAQTDREIPVVALVPVAD